MMTQKEKEQAMGIAVPGTKKFYYLVAGPIPTDLNKLHNILVGADILKIVDGNFTPNTTMSMFDAEEAGFTFHYYFVSKIVKDAWEKQHASTTSSLWG